MSTNQTNLNNYQNEQATAKHTPDIIENATWKHEYQNHPQGLPDSTDK